MVRMFSVTSINKINNSTLANISNNKQLCYEFLKESNFSIFTHLQNVHDEQARTLLQLDLEKYFPMGFLLNSGVSDTTNVTHYHYYDRTFQKSYFYYCFNRVEQRKEKLYCVYEDENGNKLPIYDLTPTKEPKNNNIILNKGRYKLGMNIFNQKWFAQRPDQFTLPRRMFLDIYVDDLYIHRKEDGGYQFAFLDEEKYIHTEYFFFTHLNHGDKGTKYFKQAEKNMWYCLLMCFKATRLPVYAIIVEMISYKKHLSKKIVL